MNKLLFASIMILVFGCDTIPKSLKFHAGDSALEIPKSNRQYWIVLQGIHRNQDTVFVVELPNSSASEIEDENGGYESICMCPSDFIITKTDSVYSINFLADVFTSDGLGTIQARGNTYGYKYHHFVKALSASHKGVRVRDSSVGPNSKTWWLRLKASDKRFVGYSSNENCDVFDYRFRNKYYYSDRRTTAAVANEFAMSGFYLDNCGNKPEIPLQFFICSDRHFWTDSVDICVRASGQLKNWLSEARKGFEQNAYKNYYNAYYVTDKLFDKLPNKEKPQIDSNVTISFKRSEPILLRGIWSLPK